MDHDTYSNVEYLMKNYGKHLKSEWHLVLLYWQKVDGVEMNKEHISTPSLLEKGTSVTDILSSKLMFEVMEKGGSK